MNKENLKIVSLIFAGGISVLFWQGVFDDAVTVVASNPVEIEMRVTAELVSLTNYERTSQGLNALIISPELEASAREKACDMKDRGYFAHEDPDGNMPWHLFKKHGYYYSFAGENLVWGYTGIEANNALMASPKHKENILSPFYTEIGISTCGDYIVQHFGKR